MSYLSGLGQLPKRKPVSKLATSEEHSDEEQTDEERDKESVDLDRLKDEEISESDIAYAKARAVLNANISACYLKLVSKLKSTTPLYSERARESINM